MTHSSSSPADKPSSSLLPFGLALLVGLIFYYVLWQQPKDWADDGAMHPAVGQKMNGLRLAPLVNTDQELRLADVQGDVVLINYWGPWCGPCRVEMPHLVELERQFSGQPGFRLLSVSCGLDGPYATLDELRRQTASFARELGIDFAIYHDPAGESRAALAQVARFEGFAYPTTVLVDGDHVIRGLWVGYQPGLEREIASLLEGVLD